ncbi:MAG: hypothetical protein HYX42_04095 [Polaromonas sp.]|uniref:hypothetical protein n=1 Tax=Polaromonas sp. TaxID=1869339 RepID=UPI0025F709B9|nr:hypothetical protein [Polaromonas sp.]MBI2725412.1 hypothetical protein [Polaromonas sp.]
MTRYALRVDANQAQIVSALQAAGATVEVIGKPVDLLIGISGRWMMMECKDGQKPKSAQKPTPAQERFFKKWAGYPLAVVDSAECALRMLRVLEAG